VLLSHADRLSSFEHRPVAIGSFWDVEWVYALFFARPEVSTPHPFKLTNDVSIDPRAWAAMS